MSRRGWSVKGSGSGFSLTFAALMARFARVRLKPDPTLLVWVGLQPDTPCVVSKAT